MKTSGISMLKNFILQDSTGLHSRILIYTVVYCAENGDNGTLMTQRAVFIKTSAQ